MQNLNELPAYLLDGVHHFLESSCIFALTDVRGTIVFANDAFCAISGYSRDELIGQNHRLLRSGRHSPEFYRDLWRTIAGGNVWREEICNRAKDGRLYWVDSTIAPMCNSAGQITHYCALRIDITARKVAQAQLIEGMQRETEAQKMASVGRLADAVCHDINNLLGGALILTDMLGGTREQQDLQRSMLLRMAQLIRTVRDFSTGRPAERRVFNAGTMIADTCKLVSFDAVRTGRVNLDVDVRMLNQCEFKANEGQILEVLLNLMGNSIEAMKEQPDASLRVWADLDATAATAHIFVEDNGPGIPDELQGTLFEPFVSTKGQGRGVGLAAARRIATEHGGELELVESAAGARFRFTMPVHDAPAADFTPLPASEVVLVADDDAGVVASLSRALEAQGFRPISSSVADEVLVRAEQFKDRLAAAVLDALGNAEEFALVGYLRSLQPNLTVILTSAGLRKTGEEDTRYGPVHFLPKPFESKALIKVIREGHHHGPLRRSDRGK
jgi:PAS domain S-box-containing protein